jgi:hypothetical protein
MFRSALFADPICNPEVRVSHVIEQFGQVRADRRVFIKQQLLEHSLVDRNHLLEMGSKKVHGGARCFRRRGRWPPFVNSLTALLGSGGFVFRRGVPVPFSPKQHGCVCVFRNRIRRRSEVLKGAMRLLRSYAEIPSRTTKYALVVIAESLRNKGRG